MKALTIRQPWAFAVCKLGKRIENRTWRTTYRGPILIHAAPVRNKAEMDDGLREIMRILQDPAAREKASPVLACEGTLSPRGAIVAVATLVDVTPPWGTRSRRDPWHMADAYGWQLSFVRMLEKPIACKGRPGLWDVPAEIVAQVRAQIGGAS